VPLVGIVGRLTPIKNHRLFLEAAAAVLAVQPDAHFLVVGDGEIGPSIRAMAHRLGVMPRTIFTGWRYDLPRVYADLDVLVSCSKNEGTPFTIVEAMAAGCPVVATRVGGVPDLHHSSSRDPADICRTLQSDNYNPEYGPRGATESCRSDGRDGRGRRPMFLDFSGTS